MTRGLKRNKILILRLSSFGDIAQCLFVLSWLKARWPDSEIHWVVREEFKATVESFQDIDRVHVVQRSAGLKGLFQLTMTLRHEGFDLIYDAHSNLRSHLMCFPLVSLSPSFWLGKSTFVRRGKNRIRRWLLFRFKINLFPKPFVAADSYLEPLKHKFRKTSRASQHTEASKEFSEHLSSFHRILVPQLKNEQAISLKLDQIVPNTSPVLLVPGAAWPLKMWPLSHWKELIRKNQNRKFVLIGGPSDEFCFRLAEEFPDKVLNLAGKLSWKETVYLVQRAGLVISNDTGVLHFADLLRIPSIALIGPTAFGYPTSPQSIVLESHLSCKPCSKDGRGKCYQSQYQKCLFEVTPEKVISASRSVTELSL